MIAQDGTQGCRVDASAVVVRQWHGSARDEKFFENQQAMSRVFYGAREIFVRTIPIVRSARRNIESRPTLQWVTAWL